MTERADRLRSAADAQVAELTRLIGRADPDSLRRLAPGREKLGDGTLAALARHTADNYLQIADFALADHDGGVHDRGGHRIPRILRILGHRPPRDHGPGSHSHSYVAAEVDLGALGLELAATRKRFEGLSGLDDRRLDRVPPAGSFRFCDGGRALEEVLVALLHHQGHQLDAIRAAVR